MKSREGSPQLDVQPSHERSELPIEQQANFEGHDAELLFKRISDPVIKEQIVDLLLKADIIGSGDDRVFQSADGPYKNRAHFVPQSREEVLEKLDERIASTSSVTPISYSSTPPTADAITLDWINDLTDEPLTQKQMAIVEAHEKGHSIRQYHGALLDNYFKQAFDLSCVSFVEKDYAEAEKHLKNMGYKIKEPEQEKYQTRKEKDLERIRKSLAFPSENEDTRLTREDVREKMLIGLFDAMEITERMSQLKNYFGMDGHQHFSKEHLAYARSHYLDDIKLDNRMTQFFQAITPETEEKFLELINSSGI